METVDFFIIVLLIILFLEITYLMLKANTGQGFFRGKTRKVLLDTSVLIDGRIVSVANSGFLSGTILIPRSVVGELQYLADSADHDKRARARHGLDVVAELQKIPLLNVEILQDGSKAVEGVDDRLLTLSKRLGAAICTLDYNLNKVALVENVEVLNVNELAQSLRMAHLPGEKVSIQLVQKGQDAHQGVGYLPDGTMVVVENASRLMGQMIEVEVIRSLQTSAGRMMFAKHDQNNDTVRISKIDRRQSNKPAPGHKSPKAGGRQYRSRKPRPSKDAESSLIDLVEHS